MAKPQLIQKLLPQAQQALAHPTQAAQASIDKARKWLAEQWRLVGNETPEEKAALESAFERCVHWLAAWRDGLEPRWLVLYGPSGTGKTFLAKRIAAYVNRIGDTVYENTVAKNLAPDNSMRCYSYAQECAVSVAWRDIVPFGSDKAYALERAGKDWFKVIDDLKPQTGSPVTIDGETGIQPRPFEVTAAGDLLDERLRRWTVITSNLTGRQLALFWDPRISSRLLRNDAVAIDFGAITDYGLRVARWNEGFDEVIV